MKRTHTTVMAGVVWLLAASGAGASNNDCCFDTTLPLIGGHYQCVSEPDVTNCFGRSGIQIWCPAYECDQIQHDQCELKLIGGAFCSVFEGGKPDGDCTLSDLVFEARAVPGISPHGLAVVAALVTIGAVLALRRRATGNA